MNPVANDVCPIYKMNSREYCLIKTERFGTLLQMEVGALMVGKISNNQQGLGFVHKGVEKGRFEFGGSTIILLTQKNVVIPDRDLLEHTGSGMADRTISEPFGCIIGYADIYRKNSQVIINETKIRSK